ncbi:MAG: hypothetical protein LBL54_04215 [Clostridiales Family XIII bacterium]|jgi:hypothetical protein|nr:hypothetical protein [Clostridiales Family XIII bacterium]
MAETVLPVIIAVGVCVGFGACANADDSEFWAQQEEQRRAEKAERAAEERKQEEYEGISRWGSEPAGSTDSAQGGDSSGGGFGSETFPGGTSNVSLAEFPIEVREVSVTLGKNANTYVNLSVENTGNETITDFTFTYIGYDRDGEVRADADDERFTYSGAIEPGETLDLNGEPNGWQLKDHAQEGYFDDYGGDWDVDEGYSDWPDQQNFQDRMIAGAKVSVYSAHTADDKTLRLDNMSRQWSDKASLS